MAKQKAERRRDPRARLEVEVRVSGLRGSYRGRTINLGRGGIFVETDQPYPVGGECDLEFDLGDGSERVRAVGEVRHHVHPLDRKRRGMGLKFLRLAQADAERVSAYVTEHAIVHHPPPLPGRR